MKRKLKPRTQPLLDALQKQSMTSTALAREMGTALSNICHTLNTCLDRGLIHRTGRSGGYVYHFGPAPGSVGISHARKAVNSIWQFAERGGL